MEHLWKGRRRDSIFDDLRTLTILRDHVTDGAETERRRSGGGGRRFGGGGTRVREQRVSRVCVQQRQRTPRSAVYVRRPILLALGHCAHDCTNNQPSQPLKAARCNGAGYCVPTPSPFSGKRMTWSVVSLSLSLISECMLDRGSFRRCPTSSARQCARAAQYVSLARPRPSARRSTSGSRARGAVRQARVCEASVWTGRRRFCRYFDFVDFAISSILHFPYPDSPHPRFFTPIYTIKFNQI